MITIGIIGGGFVGKATNLLGCDAVKILVYDIIPEACSPLGTTLNDLCECDLIFISVPTPMEKDGSCFMGIVESVLNDLVSEGLDLDVSPVVIRSTVPPGSADRLNCFFMPEFLTEKNFERDFIHCKEWIFGLKGPSPSRCGQNERFISTISELFNKSKAGGKIMSNKMTFLSNSEAEMVKLFRNTFLATKVSFCNEFETFCKSENVSYDNVIACAASDSRIGLSHTSVPGHDGKRGFSGTCFPKDIANVYSVMKKKGTPSYIIKNVIERNNNVDRPECDWNDNKGRTVV